jgi:hypothetical protein
MDQDQLELDDNTEDTVTVTDNDEAQGKQGEEDRGDGFEPSSESAEQAETAEPAEPAEPDAPGKKNAMVPIDRFHAVNEERKQLLAMNERLIAQLSGTPPAQSQPEPQQAPAFDLVARNKDYATALLDGDEAKAAQIRADIDIHLEGQATARALAQFEKMQQQSAFQAEAARLKATYPELDESNQNANQDAIEYVILQRNSLVQRGIPLYNALNQAAEKAAAIFGLGPRTAPAGIDSPTQDPRRVAQAQRNAQASNAQPAPLAGVGERATKAARYNVETMSEDEFASLPAAEKRRLRGDGP